MEFINLKNDEFTYIGKNYIQNRFLSADKKIVITYDNLDLVKVYAANADGKGERVYLKDNEMRNPICTVLEAMKLLMVKPVQTDYTLIINETQFQKFKNKAA